MTALVITADTKQLEFLQWMQNNILFPPKSPYMRLINMVLQDGYYSSLNRAMLNELRVLHSNKFLKLK